MDRVKMLAHTRYRQKNKIGTGILQRARSRLGNGRKDMQPRCKEAARQRKLKGTKKNTDKRIEWDNVDPAGRTDVLVKKLEGRHKRISPGATKNQKERCDRLEMQD